MLRNDCAPNSPWECNLTKTQYYDLSWIYEICGRSMTFESLPCQSRVARWFRPHASIMLFCRSSTVPLARHGRRAKFELGLIYLHNFVVRPRAKSSLRQDGHLPCYDCLKCFKVLCRFAKVSGFETNDSPVKPRFETEMKYWTGNPQAVVLMTVWNWRDLNWNELFSMGNTLCTLDILILHDTDKYIKQWIWRNLSDSVLALFKSDSLRKF